MIIHSVNKRNGAKHTKNENTTAPSINTTCLRALKLSSGLLGRTFTMRPSLAIRFLAIIVYNTINVSRGNRKNIDIVIMKYVVLQKLVACVKQTGTCEPSRYSSADRYSAISRIGLCTLNTEKKTIFVVVCGCFLFVCS